MIGTKYEIYSRELEQQISWGAAWPTAVLHCENE